LRALDLFGVPHILAKIGALILLLFGTAFILSYLFLHFRLNSKFPSRLTGGWQN
jgi:hypothetical protein